MTTRTESHEMVDRLPEEGLDLLGTLLADPALPGLLKTPAGEPPLSLEELVGILEGKRDVRAGRVTRFADAGQAIRWLHSEVEQAGE